MPRESGSKKGTIKWDIIFFHVLKSISFLGKGGKYKKKGKRVSHTLTQDDIEFLKKNTRYDEQEIKEWYR